MISVIQPTFDQMVRCKALRIASKMGTKLTSDEIKFLNWFFSTYPNDYPSDTEIFEETKPIGS